MSQKDIQKALQKYQPKLDQDYQKNLQVAKYTNLTDIEQSNYLQLAGIDKDGKVAYFFIDGNVQHQFDNNKLLYHSITIMDKKIDQNTFVILYVVADDDGTAEFDRFRKKFLKQLPAKYYLQLRQIYVYHASILVKTKLWLQQSKRGKLWNSKTKCIGNIDDLLKLPNFIPQWLNLLPKQLAIKPIQQLEPEYIEVPKGVFGIKLEYQKPNQFGIPMILDQLLSYFDYNGERFLKPDIFRKQGSIDEENQLFQLLNSENYDCLNVVDDIRLVSSMIKKFFTLLPEPLIPQILLKYISTKITKLTPETELVLVEDVLNKMPSLNRILLSVMTSFLLTVGNYSEFNHMNMQNLAIVFAPCFMRAQTNDISSLEQIGHSVKFLKILFDHFDKMFPNFTFKLFLQPKKNPLTSSDSSNSSTGPDTSNKNQSNSSSESGEEKINEIQQKIE